jgi:hypothetical protein
MSADDSRLTAHEFIHAFYSAKLRIIFLPLSP